MFKINLIVFFLLFTTSQVIADKKQITITDINASKTFPLLKINHHIITSDVFPKRKANAFRYKFNKNEKKAILNQLINDEIAIQYAFNYLKIEDNLTNEAKRLSYGLTLIDKVSIKEIIKNISDKNASSFYTINKKDYWHEKNYEASHILVDDENTSKELIEKLKLASNMKEKFQELAEKFSKGLSAKRKGYLGHFQSKIMVKPFKKSIENLKIGSYTDTPIKTKFGYHIILLHNIVEKGYIPFKRVKAEIKYNLAKKHQSKWFEKTLTPIKKEANIEYLFDINNSH